MSLQLIAKQMEAKGRGGDSVLVHMTPGEVAGLQQLAESAGGSLSVNPETGLVEANFLKRMLPTLVGLGVGIGTGNPFLGAAAGAAVGGYQAKQDDQDVGMGALMGGLGGYGGAGIGAGLGAAGSTAAQAGVMSAEAAKQAGIAGTQQAAQQAAIAEGAKVAGAEAAQTSAQQLAAEKVTQEAAADMARREAGAAAINQAAQTEAERFAAQGVGAQANQGIQALAGQPGRDAFFGQVGMKTAGMAAAPLLAPEEQKVASAPVDDEMYYYDYTPVQSGRRSDTSTEVNQISGGFSPGERIKASDYMERRNRQYSAAQGGLLSYAEGGEATTTDGANGEMSGASKAAFDYLMGNAPSSAAGLPALAAQAPASPAANIGVGGDNMYAFDPATGAFTRNPGYDAPTTGAQNAGLMGSLLRDSGGSYEPVGPNADFDTPAKQAAYYAANPTMGAITRAGQTALSYTPSMLFARAAAPEYMAKRDADAARIARGDYSNGFAIGSDGSPASGYGTDSWSGGMDSYAGSDIDQGDRGEAAGGLISLAKGGMASGGFVVPADVVSALGNGSTDAGLRKLYAMLGNIKPIKGKGDGLSDSIPTSIDGKQRARVADGEAYIDPKTVKRVGGAKKLYAMMDKIRAQAHGKTSQQRKVNPAKVLA